LFGQALVGELGGRTMNRYYGILVLAVSVLLSSPSFSTTTMGVYFDPEGTITEITTTENMETVPIYVVLHGLGEQFDLTRWQCQIATAGSGYTHSWELSGEGNNVFTAPHFLVFLDGPLPPGDSMVLATGQLTVTESETPTWLYLQASPHSVLPGYGGYPDFRPAIFTTQYVGQWEISNISPGSNCEPGAVANDWGQPPNAGPLLAPENVALTEDGYGEFTVVNSGPVAAAGSISTLSGETVTSYEARPFGSYIQIFLDPGQSKTITVQYPGQIRIWGCGASVDVSVQNGLVTYPDVFDLGEVVLNGDPITHSFTLHNYQVTQAQIEISSTTDLSVDISELALEPGETRSGFFTFTPLAFGYYEGQIVFTDTVTGASSEILVQATVRGSCAVEPGHLDFGPVSPGYPQLRSVTISNLGNDTISGIVSNPWGPDLQPQPISPFIIRSGEGPFSLAPGKSLVVSLG